MKSLFSHFSIATERAIIAGYRWTSSRGGKQRGGEGRGGGGDRAIKSRENGKTVIAVILICTVHAAARNFSFFLSIFFFLFFFRQTQRKRESGARQCAAQSSRSCYLPLVEELEPERKCVFLTRACRAPLPELYKSPTSPPRVQGEKRAAGLG